MSKLTIDNEAFLYEHEGKRTVILDFTDLISTNSRISIHPDAGFTIQSFLEDLYKKSMELRLEEIGGGSASFCWMRF